MKKENTPNLPENYSIVHLVHEFDISFLEGKLLTLIESFGLPATQEKAGKSFVKEMLWDWYYSKERRKQKYQSSGLVEPLVDDIKFID
jgi:hypothetical protein